MIFLKLIPLAVMSYVSIYYVFECIKTETANYIDWVIVKSAADKIPNHCANCDIDKRIDKNYTIGSETYDCLPFKYNDEERMKHLNWNKAHKSNLTFNERTILSHKNIGLIPTECGYVKKRRKKRLAVGRLVKDGNYPWMARIFHQGLSRGLKYEYEMCSGTVINERYILTAGHCLHNGNESPFKTVAVAIGTEKVNPQSKYFEIEKLIKHENFSGPTITRRRRRRHDIGLIRLKEKIPKSELFPICLPFSPSNYKFPKKLKHFNFTLGDSKYSNMRFIGVSGANNHSLEPILKSADFKIINLQTCRKEQECFSRETRSLERSRIFEGEQFCAGSFKNGNSVLETGDSGGPLLYEELNYPTYQVGIMSFGANLIKYPPNARKPDVFQNVQIYLEWILDNISE